MAAVTADQIPTVRSLASATEIVLPIKTAGTVYVGALVNITTLGRVKDAANTAGETFGGEVIEILNDTGGYLAAATGNAAGTVKAKIRYGHEMLLTVLTAARTQSNLGRNVYVSTNVEVTDLTAAGTAAVRVIAGTLTQFGATTATGWVRLKTMGAANAGV